MNVQQLIEELKQCNQQSQTNVLTIFPDYQAHTVTLITDSGQDTEPYSYMFPSDDYFRQ